MLRCTPRTNVLQMTLWLSVIHTTSDCLYPQIPNSLAVEVGGYLRWEGPKNFRVSEQVLNCLDDENSRWQFHLGESRKTSSWVVLARMWKCRKPEGKKKLGLRENIIFYWSNLWYSSMTGHNTETWNRIIVELACFLHYSCADGLSWTG